MPKTNAPVLALEPTTSEIKLIPVDNTIVCETPRINKLIPTKAAMIYITHPI